MNKQLFRKEVIEARRAQLDGEVLIVNPPSIRLYSLLIFLIASAVTTWLAFRDYARTETAKGVLVTIRPTAQMVPPAPGYVTRLFVADGQQVLAGQPLMTMRTEAEGVVADSSSLNDLKALQSLAGINELKKEFVRQREQQSALDIRMSVRALRRQEQGLRNQIKLQEQMLASLKASYDRISMIADQGFVTQTEIQRRLHSMLSAQQELERLQNQLRSSEADTERTKASLDRNNLQAKSDFASADSDLIEIVRQEAQARARRQYTMTAPISGRVTAVQTGIGKFAGGLAPLMVIVPESMLKAEVYAPVSVSGLLKVGQKVKIHHDAFPYQRYGSFDGVVTSISESALASKDVSASVEVGEPSTKIDIKLSRQSVVGPMGEAPLRHGMTLEATFVIEKRNLFDWLLEPLASLKGKAS